MAPARCVICAKAITAFVLRLRKTVISARMTGRWSGSNRRVSTMSDITKRLRASISADTPARYPGLVNEAINEIESLRAERPSTVMDRRILCWGMACAFMVGVFVGLVVLGR